MGRLSRIAVLAGVAALVAAPGCGTGGSGSGDGASSRERQPQTTRTAPSPAKKRTAATVTPSHCPPGYPSCRTTEGRIVVRVGLRPHPLPEPGDLISAAGPVQTGSYGQHQIHALELHVAGR